MNDNLYRKAHIHELQASHNSLVGENSDPRPLLLLTADYYQQSLAQVAKNRTHFLNEPMWIL